MKTSLFIIIGIIPVTALADDPLPKRPDFNRYQAMLNRSPFAIATVAVPTSTPDFAKDLYIANAAHLVDADTVPAANIPTGQANSSAGPDPSARSDPAKSNSGSADAKRAAPGRGRGIVSRYCPQSSSEVSGIRSGPAEYKSYLVGFF